MALTADRVRLTYRRPILIGKHVPRRSEESVARSRGRFGRALKQASSLREACAAVGISESTGRRWRRELQTHRASDNGGRVPVEVTSFEGRSAQLRQLSHQLRSGARLTTVLGPPGIGKTRLVTRWIRTLAGQELAVAPVAFCDLRAANTESQLVELVARELGIHITDSSAIDVAVVGDALVNHGKLLLVLDNFESLVSEAAAVLGTWLRMAPELVLLVTSRRVLGLRGEHVFELPPLSFDARDCAVPGESEASRLFLARARETDPLIPEEVSEVVLDIVRHTEGLPLAIELAASQLRRQSLSELRAGLRRTRIALVSPFRDAAPHHRTLARAIEGSWELLSGPAQACLAQLSVFRGSFTTDAARSVVISPENEGSFPHFTVEEILGELRDASLLRTIPAASTSRRWDLFEAIREFGAARLCEDVQDKVSAQHAAYYLRCGEEYAEALTTGDGRAARHHLAQDFDNLQAALTYFLGHAESNPGLPSRMARVVATVSAARLPAAALRSAREALKVDQSASPHVRARLLLQCAELNRELGQLNEAEVAIAEARLAIASDPDLLHQESDLNARTGHELGLIDLARGSMDQARGEARGSARERSARQVRSSRGSDSNGFRPRARRGLLRPPHERASRKSRAAHAGSGRRAR